MARKRGGIAGFYDRNKKVIIPAATGLAGLFGTPALGAAVGAAFGGLDRPGKSGIGIDAMGAAKGGLSGYAAGSAGQSLGKMAGIGKIGGLQSAGSKLGSMFTGRLPGMAAGKLPSMPDGFTSAYDTKNRSPSLDSLGNLFGKEGLIEQNKTILSGIGRGVMGERAGARADEQAELQRIEDARQFDAGLAQRKAEGDFTGRRVTIEEAEEAERKRVAAATQANRDKYLAMFTGGAMA
jgi:hypothetical protein